MGTVRTIQIADPGAGNNWSLTVPAGISYLIKSFACRLDTSADVGNRRFGYLVDDGTDTGVYLGSISNTNQTASQQIYIAAYPGSEAVAWTSGMLNLGMPSGLYLPPGHRLRMYTGIVNSMFPADAYSQIHVRVEEFPYPVVGV